MEKIGIIGAMDEEIKHYISELVERHEVKQSGLMFYEGIFQNKDVVVVKSGAGKVNASMTAQLLITKFKVSHIIFTGVAGALNPKLNILDVVVSKDCIQHDMDAEKLGFKKGQIPFTKIIDFKSSNELKKIALESAKKLKINAIEGRILTGDQFITEKEKNLALIKDFKGDCVDMESASVAHVCQLNNIPYIAIRSISDKADHSATMNFTEFFKKASQNSFLLVKEMLTKMPSIKQDRKNIIKSKIRTVPNWPKKGIMFRDITTLLKDPEGFKLAIDELVKRYSKIELDLIVGIESRGFIIGAVLADRLGKGFIPIRKKGKLPAETEKQEYKLEYGTDTIEIHKDAIKKNQKILVVDDLLATGGTMNAAVDLIKKLGGNVVECVFIIDLPELKGREKLEQKGMKVFTLVEFEGE